MTLSNGSKHLVSDLQAGGHFHRVFESPSSTQGGLGRHSSASTDRLMDLLISYNGSTFGRNAGFGNTMTFEFQSSMQTYLT